MRLCARLRINRARWLGVSLSETWGTTPGERERDFPCDASLAHIDAQLYRGITINAPRQLYFAGSLSSALRLTVTTGLTMAAGKVRKT